MSVWSFSQNLLTWLYNCIYLCCVVKPREKHTTSMQMSFSCLLKSTVLLWFQPLSFFWGRGVTSVWSSQRVACAGLKRETRNNWIYNPCIRACMYSGSMNTSELQAVSMILPLHFSSTRLLNELLLWRGKWLHSNNSSRRVINLKENHSLKCLHHQVDHTHGCGSSQHFFSL